MEIFDRVFQCQNMLAAVGVDIVDHGGQCGGLSASGGSGHEDQPAFQHGDLADRICEAELFKVEFAAHADRSCHEAGTVDRFKEVHTETVLRVVNIGDVVAAGMGIFLFPRRSDQGDSEPVDLFRRDFRELHLKHFSAGTAGRDFPGGNKQVGYLVFQSEFQQCDDVFHELGLFV